MAVSKHTSLSVGRLLRSLLLESEGVRKRSNGKIFPVRIPVDPAELPYIAYMRTGVTYEPDKGDDYADTAQVAVSCYSADYESGVELAESVRDVLDGAEGYNDEMAMRSCTLVNADETWEGDAFVQNLVFEIRI